MIKTKRSIDYKLVGTLEGEIWSYNQLCTKDFTYRFVTHSGHNGPFKTKHESLQDAIDNVLNDGDFQSCHILDATLIVSYFEGRKHIELYYNLDEFEGLEL